MRLSLRGKLIRLIGKPMTYVEIEDAVGIQRDPFKLGIELSRLVSEKIIHCKRPPVYATAHPLYAAHRIHGNCPSRGQRAR